MGVSEEDQREGTAARDQTDEQEGEGRQEVGELRSQNSQTTQGNSPETVISY